MGTAKTAHREEKEKAKRANVGEILLRHGLKPKNLEVGLVKLAAICKQHTKIVRLVKQQQEADAEMLSRKTAFSEAQDKAEEASERVLAAYKDLDRIAGDDDLKEEMPLFAGETETPGKQPPPAPADDTWKKVGLATLKDPAIPAGVLKRLDAGGIGTVGDLADFQERNPGSLPSKIVGVGEVAQEKIEAAVDAFWKRRAAGPTTERKALAGDPKALGDLTEGDKGKKPVRRRRSALKGGLQE